MSHLKSDLPEKEAILAMLDPESRLQIRVTSGASEDGIALPSTDGQRALNIRVTAPPSDGRANRAVIKLLAKALNIAPSRVTLLRGEAGRGKMVHIKLPPIHNARPEG